MNGLKRSFVLDRIVVESEESVALDDTERLVGKSALINNIKAAKGLAGAVRSTLGPNGLDKMLISEGGEITVTNDGATVLEKAKVDHPTARLLIGASASQDRSARDGTTTTILIISEMLQNALELVKMGVHPTIIIRGFELAMSECLDQIKLQSKPISEENKNSVIKTVLSGKVDSALGDRLALLAIEAANDLEVSDNSLDNDRIRVKRLQLNEGTVVDTEIIQGLMIPKTRVDMSAKSTSNKGRLAIIDGGLENQKLEIEAEIEISSPGAIEEFHKRSREKLETQINKLVEEKVDLLIVRDGIADEAITMLTKAGIVAYRRFEREDIELLSFVTGAKMCRDISKLKNSDIGQYFSRHEEIISEVKYTTIIGILKGGMTIAIRGTTPEKREEVERAFDDALGVASKLNRNSELLPGGGAIQTHLARHLRNFAQTHSGREQMAIEAFAAALEVIPRVLAENSGVDPVDAILSLSAEQTINGPWMGMNVIDGNNADMENSGIIEPSFVFKQSLIEVTEAVISVLRIDDILWAKTEIGTPDWESNED